jgi:hypothetical protein
MKDGNVVLQLKSPLVLTAGQQLNIKVTGK